MTDCPDCTTARVRTWSIYRASCTSCAARSVARCLDAFNALDAKGNRDLEPLKATITRTMPNVPYADAKRAVWEWWQHDHKKEGPTL